MEGIRSSIQMENPFVLSPVTNPVSPGRNAISVSKGRELQQKPPPILRGELMKIVVGNIAVGVSAKHDGEVYGFPNEKNERQKDFHNRFRIKILRNGKERSFTFYGSTKDYYDGKVEMDESDLKCVLKCYCDEALSGLGSFADFCSNFGYDEDSRSALATYNAVQKTTEKMSVLGFTEDELIGVINYFNEF
jgi:hypothetical protein